LNIKVGKKTSGGESTIEEDEAMADVKQLNDYAQLLEDIKARIQATRTRVALAINRELIVLYWDMGKMIVERQQQHGWGDAVIDRLSRDLRRAFPENKGFSRPNLYRMRMFYLAYQGSSEFVSQLARQIPWWHNIVILEQVKDPQSREYYLRACAEHGWSRAVLVHQIETDAYSRHALSTKTTTFRETLPAPLGEQAEEMLKDPYVFDFITLDEAAKEIEIERALLQRLRDFLLELGRGFAFLGSQYRLEVGGKEYFLDLLFYHRLLRSLVVIDLKVGEFEPEMAGKMNFYLNVLDAQVKLPEENPTIGIILCKGKNRTVAEYALRGIGSPIGVAGYQLTQQLPRELQQALPSIAELEEHLNVEEGSS
jgi:predicted nuclease of restriction endonuclease-like (RecB) superfamily